MSASERPRFTQPVTGFTLPCRAIERCHLWAFGWAQMGPCLSALPFVALWALCELLCARALEGG